MLPPKRGPSHEYGLHIPLEDLPIREPAPAVTWVHCIVRRGTVADSHAWVDVDAELLGEWIVHVEETAWRGLMPFQQLVTGTA